MWLTFNLYPLQTEIYKAMICFKESTGKKKKKGQEIPRQSSG